MKEHFIQAIENLKQMVAEMAAKVERTLQLSVDAVAEHDDVKARQVIDGDNAIDRQEIKIEEECLKILALYQPVAGDLRTVITILKVNNEIERVGDLAVNIAERALDIAGFHEEKIEKFEFDDMVTMARDMLKKSLDSMVYRDVITATEVIRMDDAVDDLHRANYGKVKEMVVRHPNEAGYYLDCLTVSRCLERIADIATNICEDVIYLEHGRIVRHSNAGNQEAGRI